MSPEVAEDLREDVRNRAHNRYLFCLSDGRWIDFILRRPGELLDANIPVIRRFSNTPIASEVVNREPTAKSGKANSEQPQPPSLILTLHRLLLRSWQRLRRLARFRWCSWRNRRRWRSSHSHRPSADFNRSLFAVHYQARAVRSNRTAGARLIVAIVSFDFFEVALDLSLARARLNLDRRVGRNRNLHVPLTVIDLDISRLWQPTLDRPFFIFLSQGPIQALHGDILRPCRQAHPAPQT